MATPTRTDHEHGRHAVRPWEIPKAGWKDIVHRVKNEVDRDNVSFVAAGVAFYGLLSIFPALAALVGIYGLVADPVDVQRQLQSFTGILPPEAQSVIAGQLEAIAGHATGVLSIGVLAGLIFSVWTASRGMVSLITALNIVYNEKEQRNFLQLNGLALLLTLGAILFGVTALGLVIGLPTAFNLFGLGRLVAALISVFTWPLLGLVFMLGLAVVYHYAPCRDRPRWDWTSPGAVLAAVLWLMGSALFAFYVANFANYNETYGSVGAIVILLTWFYLTAYLVLLGGEVNAELERQTVADTTEGEPEPMGERSAYAADTLGPTADQQPDSGKRPPDSPPPETGRT